MAINPAAARSLHVALPISPTTAGTAGSFTVSARDAYGNTATGYTGTVHFTSSDAQAALPADYTFTNTDAGVHNISGTHNTTRVPAQNRIQSAACSITDSQT